MGAGAALLPIGIPILVTSITKVDAHPGRVAQARGLTLVQF
jgi:predicted cation transporter